MHQKLKMPLDLDVEAREDTVEAGLAISEEDVPMMIMLSQYTGTIILLLQKEMAETVEMAEMAQADASFFITVFQNLWRTGQS